MINKENFNKETILNVIENFPLEPMFNKVIITLNVEEIDNFLVLSDNTMDDRQFIVAKGSHVQNLSVGDEVLLDIEKMMIKIPNPENAHEMISSVKLDPVMVNGNTFAIIEDRLIKAKYTN
jgi:hypothetical protein